MGLSRDASSPRPPVPASLRPPVLRQPRRRLLETMLAAAGAAVLWLLMRAIEDDRISALLAGAALAACLYVGLGPLRLPVLSPPMLYLCVFALFHLGLALPWALGAYDGRLPGWFLTHHLTPALGLVGLATLSYLAGLLWARPGIAPPPAAPVYTNQFLFGCGVTIYLAGAFMFFLGVERVGWTRFWDAGYAEVYRLAAQFDPRLFGTSFLIVPIGLYLAAASFPRRCVALVAALTLAWVGGIFFLGFRGFALIPGLVVLSLMRHRGFRPPSWMCLTLLVVVLLAIPFARLVRDQRIGERSLERVGGRVELLDGIVEMGGSIRPLVHTLEYLDQQPWRWGETYWQSLGTVWPNLGRQWEGARYMALDELPPNHWLTSQADPDLYRQAGGLGFSAVAEPYMNFGVAGVLVYFWGLGALLTRAAELRSTRPLPLAAWAVVLGPLLWTTRNSFEVFFRPALWGLAIVFAARLGCGLVASLHARSGSQ